MKNNRIFLIFILLITLGISITTDAQNYVTEANPGTIDLGYEQQTIITPGFPITTFNTLLSLRTDGNKGEIFIQDDPNSITPSFSTWSPNNLTIQNIDTGVVASLSTRRLIFQAPPPPSCEIGCGLFSYLNLGVQNQSATINISDTQNTSFLSAKKFGISNASPSEELDIFNNDGGNYQIRLSSSRFTSNRWLLGASQSNSFRIKHESQSSYTFLNPGAGSWSTGSDIRLKENIKPIESILEKVVPLKVKRYNYKGSSYENIGLIAQEVRKTFPELVNTEIGDDGSEFLSLDYTKFIYLNLKAIQEQHEIVDKQSFLISELMKNNMKLEEQLFEAIERIEFLEQKER